MATRRPLHPKCLYRRELAACSPRKVRDSASYQRTSGQFSSVWAFRM